MSTECAEVEKVADAQRRWRTAARASLNVSYGLRYQAARRGTMPSSSPSLAQSVTRENKPSRAGVVRPTGEGDKVQVLWWRGQRRSASGPFGIATMPLDKALDYVAAEPDFWIHT